LPFVASQCLGDGDHPRIDALPVSVEAQLPDDVPLVEPGKPWRQIAVAFAFQAMTGSTGVVRSAGAPGQRNHLAVAAERVANFHRSRTADGEQAGHRSDEGKASHYSAEPAPFAVGSG